MILHYLISIIKSVLKTYFYINHASHVNAAWEKVKPSKSAGD